MAFKDFKDLKDLKDLNFQAMKLRFHKATALLTLAAGIGLAIAGFIVPPLGEISNSVLMYTAQTLIYAGSVLGVNVVIDQKLEKLKGQ